MSVPSSQATARNTGRKLLRSTRRATFFILGSAALIVVLTWIGAAVQIAFERRVAERDAIAQNETRAMMLQQYVIRTLDAGAIATRHIAELEETEAGVRLRGSKDRPALIRGQIPENSNFLGLSVVDREGNILGTTLPTPFPMGNVRDHPAFRVHAVSSTGQLFVSQPAFSRLLGRKVIWLSRRLSDRDGRFSGVVAINIDPAQLTAIYEEAAVKKSEVAWVVGLDGIVRSRRTSYEVTAGEDLRGSQMFQRRPRAIKGSYIAEGPIDHQARFVSQRQVPGYPLFVSYTVRRADVLAPVRAHAWVFLGGALLITIIAAVLATFLLRTLRRRETRAAELALAKQRLEEAQRVGRIGDWQVDLETGTTRWSPQLFEMYGRDPALGAPSLVEFEAWVAPGSLERHRAGAARVRKTGEAASWEIEVVLPNRRRHHHLISAVATRDEEGRVFGLHGTTQDISEQKTVEALQAQVAHLGRLKAMDAMAATLAHELNQPLAAASNYLAAGRHILLNPAKSRDEATEAIDLARSSINLAGEIIRRVRAMVAREPTRMAPAELADIVDDVKALLPALAIDRTVEVESDLAPDAKMIVGDRVQVQQVLMNLIRNAAQASAGVSHVSILVRSAPAGEKQVCISVEDNGPGFVQEGDQPFSAFVTDKEDGLGLGLSISRTIVEAHGGRIWAENLDQGGGRVSFTLPAGPAG